MILSNSETRAQAQGQ
uniref:Uncharacterized protein n=1 Tax=Arundo donax TaxID=35708 RepID=A0A0A9A1G1_ARUDO